MVSETFKPARKERKEKQQAQQSYKKKKKKKTISLKYSLQYRLKTQSRNGLHTTYNTG